MKLSRELRCIVEFLVKEAGLPGGPALSRRAGEADGDNGSVERMGALLFEHGLIPFVAARRNSADSNVLIQAVPEAELLLAYYQSGRQAVLRAAVLQHALDVLGRDVPCVVLKGAAVVPFLYREAAERPMRDLDLLLASEADQRRAKDILLAEGFSVSCFVPGHHHLPPLYDPGGQVSVELHDNLFTPPLPRQLMDELWQRRVKLESGVAFATLDPAGLFFHHALHALSNPVDSPLLRDLFEVACLAQRLTKRDQETVREWANSSGRAALVASAARMAHQLFGVADFMPTPTSGTYERWCNWRLEWTEPLSRKDRWLRHLARERFDALCLRPHDTGLRPWVRKCAQSVARQLRKCVTFTRFAGGRLHRAEFPFAAIGHKVLVSDEKTGEVHMLNETGAAIWHAAEKPRGERDLAEAASCFAAPRQARAAIRELRRRGLLVEVEN